MKETKTEEIWTTAACFRQRVNLPAAQVAGLADAELANALCFEIEPFSGIPQAQGELDWLKLPATDSARAIFDVVQIRKTDLASELAQARAAGRRVKFVTAVPGEGERAEQLPRISARAKRGSRRSPWVLWMLLCVCALGALAYETWTIRAEAKSFRGRVAEQRRLQAEKNVIQQQIDAVQRETQALRQRHEEASRAQQRVELLRGAWPALLEAVARACRDESVVQTIRATEPQAATLTGVSLSADAATRTFVRLTETLRSMKSGWRVKPGAIGTAVSGGTVTFSCDIVFEGEGQVGQ